MFEDSKLLDIRNISPAMVKHPWVPLEDFVFEEWIVERMIEWCESKRTVPLVCNYREISHPSCAPLVIESSESAFFTGGLVTDGAYFLAIFCSTELTLMTMCPDMARFVFGDDLVQLHKSAIGKFAPEPPAGISDDVIRLRAIIADENRRLFGNGAEGLQPSR
jgi:hypothetical protein